MHPLPTTEPEIDAFLAAFEDCTLPKSRWTHSAHLFTGACYVHAHGPALATDLMRERIKRYNLAVGGQNTPTSGYHETITVAWIKLLDRLLRTVRDSAPITRADFAALAVERYAHDRHIFREYYDFDLVHSTEARARWIPPNLRDFD
ncbi:hypothetical protein [Edaphobacter bradus]|uniref:hypothetical protein n=1 Tax=Edaphobacter bradus TaxID=2259016 RepID=UPI0021DF9E0E|nr:hypothetical protein [Edaphobacter bradus]